MMSGSLASPNTSCIVHESSGITVTQGPTQDDWERHRPLIKQLWADDKKTLKEVMGIMEQHGHHATVKMYKARIKKWGLDKNHKERDMLAILRKKTEREAVGKKTLFCVRGKAVDMEDVLHDLKRKKEIQATAVFDAPTPPDVMYWTPSPGNTPRPADESAQIISEEHHTAEVQSLDTNAEAVGKGRASASPFVPDDNVIQMNLLEIDNRLSTCSRVYHSPLPPQSLYIPEQLIFTIHNYLDVRLNRGGSRIGDNDIHYTSGADVSHLAGFRLYCIVAASLVLAKSYIEFRRVLSKACSLVEGLLRAEHPKTLGYVFEVIIYMIREGLSDVSYLLIKHTVAMAAKVISKNNPWGYVWRLVSMLDPESLELAAVQSWKCEVDVFAKVLGTFHPNTLPAHLHFIHTKHINSNILEGERLLRNLLAQCEQVSVNTNLQAAEIKICLTQNLFAQEQYDKVEELGLDILLNAPDDAFAAKMNALQLIAISQFHQGKMYLAEKNIRELIDICIDKLWGKGIPLAARHMIVLEQWLREWRREEEADEIRTK